MLSNNPDGFSCGELIALFLPRRRHHIEYLCGCGNSQCRIWPSATSLGPTAVYEKIFEQFPDVQYIVDSSKDPGWIHGQSAALRRRGFGVEHVLIWKAPEAFRASWAKRGRPSAWLRAWNHYHLVYTALIRNWYSISYFDLVDRQDALKVLCERLGIPFHDGQERYWEKVQHTLFGNSSAKVHLYQKNSTAYSTCITDMAKNQHLEPAEVRSAPDGAHRTIYREDDAQPTKGAFGAESDGAEDRVLREILAHDVFLAEPAPGRSLTLTPIDRLKIPALMAWWATRRRLESLSTRMSMGFWRHGKVA